MLVEQLDRINAIVEAINLTNRVTIKSLKHLVNSMENVTLPVCVAIPQTPSYERGSGNGFSVPVDWDLHLLIRKVTDGNQAQARIEPLVMVDLFAEQFLTRPQLQFNDSGLKGIVGNASLRVTQGLSKPIPDPTAPNNGVQYWGVVFRLSITQRQQYNLNSSGV